MKLNEEITDPAYVLGRIFSLREGIQRAVNPNLNATIKDRYFDVASTTPSGRSASRRSGNLGYHGAPAVRAMSAVAGFGSTTAASSQPGVAARAARWSPTSAPTT